MAAAHAAAERLGAVEVLPAYAYSVFLKLPSGRLLLIDRQGHETRG
jgi:hypothetical protein